MRTRTLITAAVAAVLVTACGGGSDASGTEAEPLASGQVIGAPLNEVDHSDSNDLSPELIDGTHRRMQMVRSNWVVLGQCASDETVVGVLKDDEVTDELLERAEAGDFALMSCGDDAGGAPDPVPELEPELTVDAEPGPLTDAVVAVAGGESLTIAEFEGAIDITWQPGEMLSAGFARRGIQSTVTDMLQAVSDSGVDYSKVRISVMMPLVDDLGNENIRQVASGTYPRELVDQINFENFDTANVFEVAEHGSLHQALS